MAFLSLLGNLRLVEIVERLRNQVRLYGIPALAQHGRLEGSAWEHRRLIDAVLAHDAAQAVEVMRRHIEHTPWHLGRRGGVVSRARRQRR